MSLQVQHNILDDLKEGEENDQNKLRKVINIWKDNQPSTVTWETVITAFESPISNNNNIADHIRKYLKIGKLLLLSNEVFILCCQCQYNV